MSNPPQAQPHPTRHCAAPANAAPLRRRFLQSGALYACSAAALTLHLPQAAASASAANPGTSAAKNAATSQTTSAGKATAPYRWRNWSGTEQCSAQSINTPANAADVAQLMQQSSSPLRCVGAGHSFSALVPTDGILLSLDRMSGVTNPDKNASTVNVAGGTRLAVLSRQLDGLGLGMANLPDIDQQTIAGAISSATHGTGATLQAMHANVVALQLVTGQGETIDCSATNRPELLPAARVGLGALGVITQVTLKVVPAFNLKREVWIEPLDMLLGRAHQLAAKHRHFEFYYLPFTGYCAAIAHDVASGNEVMMPDSKDEEMLADLQKLRDWAGRWPSLRRWLAGKLIDTSLNEKAQNRSFKLLSTPRPTRFYETEAHVPLDAGIDCVKAVIATLEQRNDVFFPLEFRFVKGDDAWLSPFYQRDSCSVAVHALHGETYDYLLSSLGPVVRRFKARPHWGKLHAYQPQELALLYPRWQDFLSLRQSLDPHNRLLNPHLRQLFGVKA
jgi:FAD-linked oxidoreductase